MLPSDTVADNELTGPAAQQAEPAPPAEDASPTRRPQRRAETDGERTRGAILRAAASLATVDGVEVLSIGHLASTLGMSKSGLYAHFGSKLELQLATVEEASRIFDEEVVQ